MKIETRKIIKDLKGKELPFGDGFLDVGIVIAESLISLKKDEKLSAEENIKRFTIATDAVNDAELNVDAKVFVMIKESVASHFTPLVAGQVLKYLKDVESK